MANRPILITGSDTSTHDLVLDYPDRRANSTDTVTWIIHPHSGVDSIEVIMGKSGYANIWSTEPKKNNHWTGEIKAGVPANYEYEYEITWKKREKFYKYDPKITVNPTGGVGFFKLLVGFILSLFLALLSFKFLNKKRN